MDPALAGVVVFDGRKTGKIMPAAYTALLLDDEIVPLPHPGEWTTMRAHRQTYLSASLRGIFLRVERRICLRCGHIFDSPCIAFAGVAGCVPALLISLGCFGLFRFANHMTTGASLSLAWMIVFGIALLFELVGTLYVRMRFSKRQAGIARLSCPACHGGDCVSISRVAGKRVSIGSEGKWVQISIAGKS